MSKEEPAMKFTVDRAIMETHSMTKEVMESLISVAVANAVAVEETAPRLSTVPMKATVTLCNLQVFYNPPTGEHQGYTHNRRKTEDFTITLAETGEGKVSCGGSITHQLTQLDMLVQEAIGNIWEERDKSCDLIISPCQIARKIRGLRRETITTPTMEAIHESILRQSRLRTTIDWHNLQLKRIDDRYSPQERQVMQEQAMQGLATEMAVLNATILTAYDKRIKDSRRGYKINEPPILYYVSKVTGYWSREASSLLSAGSGTGKGALKQAQGCRIDGRTKLEFEPLVIRLLIDQVNRASGKGSTEIGFYLLLRKAHLEPKEMDRRRIDRLKEHITSICEDFKREGKIAGFEWGILQEPPHQYERKHERAKLVMLLHKRGAEKTSDTGGSVSPGKRSKNSRKKP